MFTDQVSFVNKWINISEVFKELWDDINSDCHDYIMDLISQYSSTKPQKEKITKEQLINILKSNSNLLDEKDDMIEYINSLDVGVALYEGDIKDGYAEFKKAKNDNALIKIANNHNIDLKSLKEFVDLIISRKIFDGELLTDLLEPLGLGWKQRRVKELALMKELIPLLKKLANGRDISGLKVYDE
jgi:type I restriction enzyme R subunit